ncbi:MAG: hypothetical protein IJX99_05535 [Clostridia bacterium]|nr:hypothetical protein [Clostridia bacterium]
MIKFFEEFKNKKRKETQRRVLELRYYIQNFLKIYKKQKELLSFRLGLSVKI